LRHVVVANSLERRKMIYPDPGTAGCLSER
jgi:hypothetical protein